MFTPWFKLECERYLVWQLNLASEAPESERSILLSGEQIIIEPKRFKVFFLPFLKVHKLNCDVASANNSLLMLRESILDQILLR